MYAIWKNISKWHIILSLLWLAYIFVFLTVPDKLLFFQSGKVGDDGKEEKDDESEDTGKQGMLSSLLNPAGADESERHKSRLSRLEMAVFGEEQREEGIAGVAQRAGDEVLHGVDASIEGAKKLVDGASGAQSGKHPKEPLQTGAGASGNEGRKGDPLDLLGGGTIADALPGRGETGGAKGKVPGVEPISDALGKIPGVGKAGKMGKVKGTSLRKGKR